MGERFGMLYGYGQQAGLPIPGHPMSRYVTTGAGPWLVDMIMPFLAPAAASGDMKSGVLISGPVAFTVHSGSDPADWQTEIFWPLAA